LIEIRHKTTGRLLHWVRTTSLVGATLRRRKLAGADLRGADLRDVELHRTDLSGADLEGALLTRMRGFRSPDELRALYLSSGTIAGMMMAPIVLALAAAVAGFAVHIAGSDSAGLLAILSIPLLTAGGCRALRTLNRPSLFRWSVRLRGANLRGADLVEADLQLADVERADLRGALLKDANIASANLRGADLSGAQMIHVQGKAIGPPTDLTGAKLRGANLQHAFLPSVDLRGADLGLCNLSAAQLSLADLRGARLTEANLTGAALTSADLRGTVLTLANLGGADLRGADLRRADLTGADLRAALSGVKLSGARYDATTLWPEGFDPARGGCVAPPDIVPAAAPRGSGSEPSAHPPGD
jgi:uncharacterized protein YjbI with pentapeptide repeats